VEVVALDVEPAMRAHAQLKAAAADVTLSYVCGDMAAFDAAAVTGGDDEGGRVQLACVLFGSAVHLLTNDAVLSCLSCVRRVLAPGGVLVLELEHPTDVFFGEHSGSAWEVEDVGTGGTLVVEWGRDGDEFDAVTQVLQRRITFTVCDAEGEVTLCREVAMPQRRFTATEVDALARAGGFRVEALYGGLELPHVPLDHVDAFRMVAVLAADAQ